MKKLSYVLQLKLASRTVYANAIGKHFEIDMEVKRIVDECYANTKAILEDKRELIEKLAEEIDTIVDPNEPHWDASLRCKNM